MFIIMHPWLLILLLLPVFIWFYVPVNLKISHIAIKIPFYKKLIQYINTKPIIHSQNLSILILIWILMLLALSDPRWVGNPLPLNRAGHNIMLALDLSESMALDDMLLNDRSFTRLSVVKQAAKQFINERVGDSIGLILFGSQAYLQTPLTYDHTNLLLRIDEADVGLAGKTTAIGDALGLAVKHLQHVPAKSRIIILLTDGVNNSGILTPLKAAELAKVANIKIYTIGLGAKIDPRALSNAFLNFNLVAELDENTLKQIANLTSGRYFRATDPGSLRTIYNTINQLEKVKQQSMHLRPQTVYYPWLLVMVLTLWFVWLFNILRWRLI